MNLNDLHDRRNRAFEAARAVVDRAHTEHRADLTGEEEAAYKRATDEVRRLDADIEHEQRQAEANAARAGIDHLVRPATAPRPGLDRLEQFFRGSQDRSIDISFGEYRASAPDGVVRVEHRDVYGCSGGGTLTVQNPTQSGRIYEVLLDAGAIWRLGPTIVQTASGNPVRWPRMDAAGTTAAITGKAPRSPSLTRCSVR